MLQTGDLLLVRAEDALELAIVRSGAAGRRLSYAHVGLVWRDASSRLWVLHAVAGAGVVRERLPRFLSRVGRAAEVWRARAPIDAARAVSRAASQLGQPYNPTYDPEEPGWCCSDFVEYALRGEKLFRLHPMHFGKGKTLTFWRLYFRRLGHEIPEGKPGISPNDLVRQGHLTRVGLLGNARAAESVQTDGR